MIFLKKLIYFFKIKQNLILVSRPFANISNLFSFYLPPKIPPDYFSLFFPLELFALPLNQSQLTFCFNSIFETSGKLTTISFSNIYYTTANIMLNTNILLNYRIKRNILINIVIWMRGKWEEKFFLCGFDG